MPSKADSATIYETQIDEAQRNAFGFVWQRGQYVTYVMPGDATRLTWGGANRQLYVINIMSYIS